MLEVTRMGKLKVCQSLFFVLLTYFTPIVTNPIKEVTFPLSCWYLSVF